MDDIIQWLAKGKDYAEGVRILDRHTMSRGLIIKISSAVSIGQIPAFWIDIT